MVIKPWMLPSALAALALLALGSALPQLQGLVAIGVAPPVNPATRIFAQAVLFIPLLLVNFMPSVNPAGTGRISKGIIIFLAGFAVIYAHFPSPFFDYVWDVALIESIFVCLLSTGLSLTRSAQKFSAWPLRLLLFKLMFCMGVVKFLHGMPEWRNFSAMKFFWENQPMPGLVSWYAAKLPDWLQNVMTFYVFVAEIPGPFLIFAGARGRMLFFWLNLFLQLGIFVSGNYGFFNLLTIALGFSLFEALPIPEQTALAGRGVRIIRAAVIGTAILWFATSLWYTGKCIWPGEKYLHETSWIFLGNESQNDMSAPVRGILKLFAAPKVSNPYALFGMIPRYRMEIGIEGSRDGKDWKKYSFRIRPDTLDRAPIWYAPHHWRLDHQMYYESFRIRDVQLHERYSFFLGVRWMPNFLGKLLEDNPKVTGLLATVPFKGQAPEYLRFKYMYYQFTTRQEKRESGNYWKIVPPHPGQFHEAIITRQNYRQLP